ncbi:DUF1624 domain-containing protein [Oscillospiraceae bacterium OttesenSCG-928-G22]|nr:DUF1624 domain-containing protein [Oscillospiraceae bacterium OttesenSCG-928-G22]
MNLIKGRENRIQIIDVLRGVSILLMVLYHFGFDLVEAGYIYPWVLYNPLLDTLQQVFAGLFIFLSGVSCRFSKHNIRRGVEFLLAAGIVTLMTWWIGTPIWFGILHFMGAAALLFGVFRKLIDKLPRGAAIVLWVVCFFVSVYARSLPIYVNSLFFLGFPGKGFYSADYFPLLPWIFVYLLGTVFGLYVADGRLPKWFYEFDQPFFAACGRYTIWIYLFHQPVLMGVTYLVGLVRHLIW